MTPILGITASSITPSILAGDYHSIATYTFSSGSGNQLVFSSIPNTYQHLQLRFFGFTSAANNNIWIRFNADTGSNYATHELFGSGASAAAGAATSATFAYPSFSPGSTHPGVFVADILDYKNTNKYKTLRSLWGYDNNGSGYVGLSSGLWQSSSAIDSITLGQTLGGATINTGTTVSLYGIKG